MVRIELSRGEDADPAIALPGYQSRGAAGADIRANLRRADRAVGLTIGPGERALVPTGLHMAIAPGYEVQVRPRSGLALSQGLTLVNSPGTIDSDYRGEVGVIVINHGADPVTIDHGDRIAQLVVAPVIRAQWVEAPRLGDTRRGAGGFGSTGRGT